MRQTAERAARGRSKSAQSWALFRYMRHGTIQLDANTARAGPGLEFGADTLRLPVVISQTSAYLIWVKANRSVSTSLVTTIIRGYITTPEAGTRVLRPSPVSNW